MSEEIEVPRCTMCGRAMVLRGAAGLLMECPHCDGPPHSQPDCKTCNRSYVWSYDGAGPNNTRLGGVR